MRHAQIERLRALKERIDKAQQSHDGKIEAEVVLVGLAELVGILLMECEDHDGVVVPPPVKGEFMTPQQRAEWEAAVKVQADLLVESWRPKPTGGVQPDPKARIE